MNGVNIPRLQASRERGTHTAVRDGSRSSLRTVSTASCIMMESGRHWPVLFLIALRMTTGSSSSRRASTPSRLRFAQRSGPTRGSQLGKRSVRPSSARRAVGTTGSARAAALPASFASGVVAPSRPAWFLKLAIPASMRVSYPRVES